MDNAIITLKRHKTINILIPGSFNKPVASHFKQLLPSSGQIGDNLTKLRGFFKFLLNTHCILDSSEYSFFLSLYILEVNIDFYFSSQV